MEYLPSKYAGIRAGDSLMQGHELSAGQGWVEHGTGEGEGTGRASELHTACVEGPHMVLESHRCLSTIK